MDPAARRKEKIKQVGNRTEESTQINICLSRKFGRLLVFGRSGSDWRILLGLRVPQRGVDVHPYSKNILVLAGHDLRTQELLPEQVIRRVAVGVFPEDWKGIQKSTKCNDRRR